MDVYQFFDSNIATPNAKKKRISTQFCTRRNTYIKKPPSRVDSRRRLL